MKCSTVYKRKNKIYFNSSSKSTAGIWIGVGPYFSSEENKQSAIKGYLLQLALKSSKEGVQHPSNWASFNDTFLNQVGVKSWGIFAKSAMMCFVELEDDVLRIIPHNNLGREGFVPIQDQTIVTSIDVSDEELGILLDKAFEACEKPF